MSNQPDGEVDLNHISEIAENFVGYGEDESTPTATTANRKSIRKGAHLLLNPSYESTETGVLLHKVVEKFLNNTGLRPGYEVPDKEAIVNALQTVLQNVNKDDDLWEWLEETSQFTPADILFAPNSLETSSNRGSLESSSLGLLSYSDLSSISLTSQDIAKEPEADQRCRVVEKTDCDPVELLCEIEELQHQNRKLVEENVRLQKQVTLTEDNNSQLFFEKEQLEKTRFSLQAQAEKKRELEQEGTVLRVTVASLEDLNARFQLKICSLEKEKTDLERRIDDLHDELCGNQSVIDTWRQRIDELTEALVESKLSYENLLSEHDICCQNLKQKIAELEEKTQVVQELITSNEVLKVKKNDLEVQLCKAEQEIACLQHAARQVRTMSADLIETEPDLNTSCEVSLLEDCSGSPPGFSGKESITPLMHETFDLPTVDPAKQDHSPAKFSTPQKSLLVQRASLCAEMRNVVRSGGGDLPSPFCGKHIFPQALYNAEVHPRTFRKVNSLPLFEDLESSDSFSKISKLDLSPDISTECQHKDLGSGASENSQIIPQKEVKDCEIQVNSEVRALELSEVLADACQDLHEINKNVETINNDAVSVLTPFPGMPGCVISEPEAINNNMVTDDKDPISMELRLLRSHIANTQAILTYLSKSQRGPQEMSFHSVLQEVENTCNKNLTKGSLKEAASLLHHLSSDMLQNPLSARGNNRPFWISKDHTKGGSNPSTSQRSTPLHRSRWLTRSCPNIPSVPQSHPLQPSTNRGTQTDHSPRKGSLHETSSKLLTVEQTEVTGNSPVVQPRHRSSSFVAAISQGNKSSSEEASTSKREGITVQAQPNREVLILKDTLQDSAYTVHKEEEGYRERDFEDVYQEFKSLRDGEENISWEREPLRRTQSEEVPEIIEAAKKRRRSFSEYNSSYCKTIDLEEHEETEREEVEEEEEEEEVIFEGSESMACRLEASHPAPQQSFRPGTGVLGTQVVGIATGAPTPNPMLGLATRLQGNAPAGVHVAGQRPEKGLVKRRGGGGGGEGCGNKGRFLMPDVMENSETESAKDSANGSMESEGPPAGPPPPANAAGEAAQPADNFITPPPPGNDPAFPSLPDSFLKKIGLEKNSTLKPEDLTGQEVECKFSTLSLAFKTDKFTLGKRLELQQRQRDTAERNIDSEVSAMRDVLNSLNQLCSDSQMRDLVTKLQHHLDIVQQSTSRMSSRAEVFGAVQQEERMSHAYEIMVAYVENLKRLYEKEHHELEETRRLLIENHLLPPANSQDSAEGNFSTDDPKRGNFRSLPSSSATGLKSEFRARVNSAVASLVNNGSAGRLERLPIGGSVSGSISSAPPTATSGPTGGIPLGFPFPSGPQMVSSGGAPHVGTHMQLSPRNSSDRIAEASREDSLRQEIQEAEEPTANTDRTAESSPLGDGLSKSGYLGELDSFLEDGKSNHEEGCSVSGCPERQASSMSSSASTCSQQGSSSSGGESNTKSSAHTSLLKQILRNSLLRKGCSMLLTWLPEEGLWTNWDMSTMTRALRYSLGSLLFLAALFSLIVTFLPTQDVPFCLFAGSAYSPTQHRSIQEILEIIFGPYVSRRQDSTLF